MQLKTPFETSFGVTQNRRILLVEAIADGVSGWGEVTAVEAPSYNSETTDTAWHIISDFIAPCVIGKDFVSAAQVPQLLDGIRGHHMAKAGVENAFWDVEAQHSGMPLSKLLGGTLTEIACGVSVGIQESPNVLVNKVERELRSGYQRIKLKIKPGKDVDFISAVRNRFPDIVLSVDANSAYRLADSDHLRTLDDFQLLMIELMRRYRRKSGPPSALTNASTMPAMPAPQSSWALAESSTSNWAALEDTVGLAGCMMSAEDPLCRYGVEACWSRALAAPTTLPCQRCRVSLSRAMCRRAAAIGMKILSSPKSKSLLKGPFVWQTIPDWVT